MRLLLLALLLTSCTPVTTAPVSVVPSAPAPKPSVLEKTCPAPGAYQAVDVSEPVTPRFLAAMKYLGIKTIIRYGDLPNETLPGKTPKAAELKMIADAGFAFEAVFQHNNRWARSDGTLYHTFDGVYASQRGASDAERMHVLYPDLPRWWYGVDFDANASQLVKVKEYATAFKKVADKYGKKVGAYGSGFVLTSLSAASLINYRWISQSSGFDGTKALTASGKYDFLQSLDKDCGGINVDFDKVGST